MLLRVWLGLMGLFILKRRKRRQSTFFKTTPENGGGDPDHMFYPTETMTDNHSLTMPMQNIPKARPLVAPLAPTGGEEEMGLYGGGGGYAQQPSGVHGYPAPTHGVYGNPSFSSSGNMAHYASPYAEQVAPPAYLHRHVPNEIDYSEPHPLPQPGYTNIVHKPDTPPSQAF
ncbi:uncharacterized protein BYT42DRAFT_564636 [Radiomyces spectabilis]|uniref:uncharacterized protein n=1 Tax=Radiomyces spectabilis TaxID=64574 RepID=UPI00221E5687|nr:uncharacterized protein BYT42DRAFT_564636 [Radiomyces spectabilis]KAI8380903.1 hypothetical protein BYT42DRAFT_564636 [Radiomyces spectabilis]